MRRRSASSALALLALSCGCGLDASAARLRQAVASEDLTAVRACLAAGASPDAEAVDRHPARALVRGGWLRTPILVEAGASTPDIVRALLDAGAEPDAAERPSGRTALLQAIHHDELDIVDVLLEAGADPGLADARGWTPLMYAAAFAPGATARTLLDAGADPAAVEDGGTTALETAMQVGCLDTALVILKASADLDEVCDLVRRSAAWVEEREHFGSSPHTRLAMLERACPSGALVPPLVAAVQRGDAGLVRELLERGEDPDGADARGWTPLLWSTSPLGGVPVATTLLVAGADPNAPSPQGWTALMGACERGDVALAELLLDAGAEVNAVEAVGGWRPLHYAALYGDEPLVRLLVEAGASVDARTRTERSARDWAKHNGSPGASEAVGELLSALSSDRDG